MNQPVWVWKCNDDTVWLDPSESPPDKVTWADRSWDLCNAIGMCYTDFRKVTGLSLRKGAKPIRVRFSAEVVSE